MESLQKLLNSKHYTSDEDIIIKWFESNNNLSTPNLLITLQESKLAELKEYILKFKILCQYSSSAFKEIVKKIVINEYNNRHKLSQDTYFILLNYIRLTKEAGLNLDLELLKIVKEIKNTFHDDVIDYINSQLAL